MKIECPVFAEIFSSLVHARRPRSSLALPLGPTAACIILLDGGVRCSRGSRSSRRAVKTAVHVDAGRCIYVEDIRISDFREARLHSGYPIRRPHKSCPFSPLFHSLGPERFIGTKAGNANADGNIQAAFLRIGGRLSLCENTNEMESRGALSIGYVIAVMDMLPSYPRSHKQDFSTLSSPDRVEPDLIRFSEKCERRSLMAERRSGGD